ncbi:MAG TPA: adenylate/guanylate cyclase domain-containing protein [Anaerolineae bacterium]|nr:adenylate/guanylate cyclase domain-containing protein [Anaerolineae bacterium]
MYQILFSWMQRVLGVTDRVGGKRPFTGHDLLLKRIAVNGALFSFLVTAIGLPNFIYLGQWVTVWFFFGVMALYLVWLGLFHYDYVSLSWLVRLLMSSGLWLSLAVTLALGGFMSSGGTILWALIAPVGTVIVFGKEAVPRWFVGYVVVLILSAIIPQWVEIGNYEPTEGQILVGFIFNVIMVSLFIVMVVVYFAEQRNEAMALLEEEQEKTEALLLNVLPPDIAHILKDEAQTIANYHEEATVLFADVAGFTPLSASMTATELVVLLNEVFSAFDDLVAAFELEKIKTIGDCYMVASGVPQARDDHAVVMARLALAMREVVREREFNGHALQFRFGMHSGSLVAGVIGQKKFIYDLWGDTVNIASRMEMYGLADEIQVTAATQGLLAEEGFELRPRGEIEVKGKGLMPVYLLQGERKVN